MHRNLQNKCFADFLSTFSLAVYTGSLTNLDTLPKDKAAKDLQVLVSMCIPQMEELGNSCSFLKPLLSDKHSVQLREH